MSTWGRRQGRTQPHQRARILKRDEHVCQLQLPGCLWYATVVDHILPLALIGADHPMAVYDTMLQSACSSCHARKTEAEKLAGIRRSNARRAARKRLPQAKHPGEW